MTVQDFREEGGVPTGTGLSGGASPVTGTGLSGGQSSRYRTFGRRACPGLSGTGTDRLRTFGRSAALGIAQQHAHRVGVAVAGHNIRHPIFIQITQGYATGAVAYGKRCGVGRSESGASTTNEE